MAYVGVGLRAVATLIDMVLLSIVGYAFAAMFGSTTATGFNLQGLPFLLWLVITFGYYIVLEKQFGWTIGKRLVGLRVVKKEGATPLDWQASVVRNVLRIVDGLFFYLVGAIVIWVSKDKQRLGDRVAETVVVRAAALGARP
jgi:uncharacterized RDD family membrane protein YckC